MDDMRGRLADPRAVKTFALAGNATLTVRSRATGRRFTYRLRAPEDQKPDRRVWFVSLMNGPDNESSFAYLGQVWGDLKYQHGRKSTIAPTAPAARAFAWFWDCVRTEAACFDKIEVWHEGRCGRCGRKLTVPESVESGFGPECKHVRSAQLDLQ